MNTISQSVKRYSKEVLSEFKSLLVKKQEIAEAEAAKLLQELNRLREEETEAFRFMETPSDDSPAELKVALQRQQKILMATQFALQRIENGVYGICSVTGNLIPVERLRAIPYTTVCIEARQ